MKSRVAILSMLVAGSRCSARPGPASPCQGNAAQPGLGRPVHDPTPPPARRGAQPVRPRRPCEPCTRATSAGRPARPSPECTPTPEGGVLPAEAGNAPTPGRSTKPAGGVPPAEASETQPTRQEAAATNSQLPFTGFAAIPVLLGGLALLTGGLDPAPAHERVASRPADHPTVTGQGNPGPPRDLAPAGRGLRPRAGRGPASARAAPAGSAAAPRGERPRVAARHAGDDRLPVDVLPVARVAGVGGVHRARGQVVLAGPGVAVAEHLPRLGPDAERARWRSAPSLIAAGAVAGARRRPARAPAAPCERRISHGVIASTSTASAGDDPRRAAPSSPTRLGALARGQRDAAGPEQPDEQRRHLPVPVDAGVDRQHRRRRPRTRRRRGAPGRAGAARRRPAPCPATMSDQHAARRRPSPTSSRGRASGRR